MDRNRTAWRDWRVWVSVGALLAIFAIDLASSEVVLLSLLLVPVLVLAVFAGPRVTAVTAVAALMLGLVSAGLTGYLGSVDHWMRFISMVATASVAVLLSTMIAQRDERLADRERRLRILLENASTVVLELDANGDCRWASPSLESALGWRPADVVGRSAADFVHPDDLGRLTGSADSLERAPRRGETFRLRVAAGGYRWMSGTLNDVTDDDGAVTSRVLGLQDADAQVRAQQETAASEVRFRAALDSFGEPFFSFAPVRDADGAIVDLTYTYLNAAAKRLYSEVRGEVLGRRLADLFPSVRDDGVLACYVSPFLTGEPARLRVPDFDGNGIAASFDVSAFPFGDEVIVTALDITAELAAQRALGDSERRFRLLAENASDVVSEGTNAGILSWVSSSVMQLAGWLPDEMAGKLFDEFIHPEDRPAAERAGAGILRGEAGTFDARLRTATGGYRWVAFTVSPVRDDAGTVVARVAGWRDVDGERRAREALEASEARYRLLVDNAMDIVIQTVEGAVQWVSPSVARVLGWGQDEMIGRRTADLWHPDDRAAAAETRDAVYAGRSSVSVYRLRRKEGTYAWIESTMQPYTERDGRAGSVGIMRDVTDRVQAVQARAESEERYRLLAENASDMVFRGGPDGVLEWVSPSVRTMLGYLPEDLVGKATAELMHPDDAAAMRAAGAQTDDDMPVSYRARMRRSDGAFTWVEVITRPVRGHSGAIIGRVGGVRDIGSQVEAQARLEESEARYHLLAENASDVVYLARPDGAIEWVSASVAGALGLRPEDLVGTRMLDLVHPDDRIAIGRVRPTALAGAAVAAPVDGFLMRIRTGSGDYRWVSWRTTQVFDDEGEPAGIVNGLSFVDELVRARERAEADEAKLQATLDSLLDPHVMLLAVRGADGTIIDFLYDDANDAACAYNGMPRDHLVGRRLLELMPGQVGAGLLAMYAAAIGSGVPLVLDDFAYPSEFRQAERRYDIRAVAVGDSLSYTWRDVTERFEFSRSMAESEERYRLLADNSSDVVVHTRDGVIAWISPSVHESLGGSPDDWTGVRLIDAIHPDDVAAYAQGSALVDVGESPIGRMRVRGRDGTYRWIATHACRYLDAAGRPDGHISAFRLVDDLVSAEGELIHQARFDALTGLLKREGALSQLTDTGQQQRVAGVERAVLFCDLDDFKAVNDERGHGSGDEFLRITAARIVGAVRAGDTVARMGGDEFLVILDGVHDVEEACAIAEKIRRAAAEPVVLLAGVVTGTLSIGVTLNVPGESADSIVSRADVAMYDAKHRGRNRVVALTAPDAPI